MNTITRRDFLKLSGAAAAASLPITSSHAEPKRPPNILVFLTDDHGQWAQHCYGNSELQTPNMDRLAMQGTRMTNAFTTTPVCSPARASFFTGRMPSQHGIHDWMNDKHDSSPSPIVGQTLIADLLKSAGYFTGLVGKWHCGADFQPKPGFDYWFSYWDSQYPHLGLQKFSNNGVEVDETGQQSPFLTDRVLEFLKKHRTDAQAKEKPFFLYVSYVDTHSPHTQAPDDLMAKYKDASFKDIPVEQFAPCHGHAESPAVSPNNPEKKHGPQRIDYYAAVSSVDREVGRVLAELEANGELADTLIVYTGDHGLNAGHHGLWEKGNATTPQNFLEESIRVSCTLSWQAGGIQQNATCADFVNHPDLWATLLEIAGATPPGALAQSINSPGVSYLSQLRGTKATEWRKTIISEYGNARMARTDRYKLIKRYPFKDVSFPDEFYDLQIDPRETTNQAKDPAFQSVITDLTAQIDQFFAKYSVPGNTGLDLDNVWDNSDHTPWVRGYKMMTKQPV